MLHQSLACGPALLAVFLCLLLLRTALKRHQRVTKDWYCAMFRKCFLAGGRARAVKMRNASCQGTQLGDAVWDIATAKTTDAVAEAVERHRSACQAAIASAQSLREPLFLSVVSFAIVWLTPLVMTAPPPLSTLLWATAALTVILAAYAWLTYRAIRHFRLVADELDTYAVATNYNLKP